MSGTEPLAFAGIAERLGKLIPRLASDHDGEVVATVTAIGRTLQGARLDWHDLAKRVTEPSYADVMALVRKSAPSQPSSWSSTAPQPSTKPKPTSPKKEPSPWPTWGTLSHFGKLAWMDAILRDGGLSATDLETFRAIRAPYYRSQEWTRKGANAFNRHVRIMWERGWRPEEKAA